MKPDIKELLELAKKAQRLRTHGDHYETLAPCRKYRKETSPDKMITLLEYVEDLESTINKARIFVDDVMPQIGGICLQDYANMNELCMALTRLEKANEF